MWFLFLLLFLALAGSIYLVVRVGKRCSSIEDGYAKIQIGLTKDKVLSLLGKPTSDTEAVCIWKYSSSTSSIKRIIKIEFADNEVISFVKGDENTLQLVPQRLIKSVKVLGIRTGLETRILATYNVSIYSLLVEYEDGKKEVVECQADSDEFKKYAPYITTENQ